MPAWGGMRRKRIWSMRDCFDHYMRGETYDHIRMDLLFNIYGFSASVWKDTVGGDSKKPAVPDEKRDGSVGKTAVLENRHKLQELQRNNTWICRVEEFLCYCGMRRRFPACTPEKWIVGNLLGMTVIFGVLLGSSGKFQVALLGIMICGAMEYLFLSTLRAEELRVTNENLLKCLNFLGNYSLTAGEITMVLGQVSRYVEEPLKGALEECAYEAQTTGDSSLALLSMAERIEHPKIKELARNLEISIRYMADLTTLVDSSRRSAREYLRMEEERKGMLREAGINMALLLGMSVFALLTVDRLIDVSVWKIVSGTLPGHLAAGIYGLILFLFLRKLYGFRR